MHPRPLPCPDILSFSTIGNLRVEQTTPIDEGLSVLTHGMSRVTTVEASTLSLREKRFASIRVRDITQIGTAIPPDSLQTKERYAHVDSEAGHKSKSDSNAFNDLHMSGSTLPTCPRVERVCRGSVRDLCVDVATDVRVAGIAVASCGPFSKACRCVRSSAYDSYTRENRSRVEML